jgi:RNA polymerase sigma-70 factor (ECF subfamily)
MRPELIQAIELLRRKTPEAVEEAIGLLQNTVYSFSMKVCGHPEDAEDTMQEVLSRSLGHLARIEDPQALAVWLYTVTRNRCWRMRRKGASAPRHLMSLDELMPDEAELGRLLQDAAALGPEANLIHAEQHHLLHHAVLRIPVQLRLVLVLHDMEELTTEQVGQILDLRPGTVRVRLHRARLSVRKEMSMILDGTPGQTGQRVPAGKKPSGPKPSRPQRPTDCRELFSNLSEYLDGRVDPRTCEEMRSHIQACPACVAFLRDLRIAIDRCRSLEIACDPAVAPRLRSILTQEYLRLLTLPTQKVSVTL